MSELCAHSAEDCDVEIILATCIFYGWICNSLININYQQQWNIEIALCYPITE